MHCSWSIDFTHKTVSVRYNKKHGWEPKAYKERTVPVPQKLDRRIASAQGRAVSRGCDLLFPTFRC